MKGSSHIYVHNTLTYTHTYTINRIILGWWYNRNTNDFSVRLIMSSLLTQGNCFTYSITCIISTFCVRGQTFTSPFKKVALITTLCTPMKPVLVLIWLVMVVVVVVTCWIPRTKLWMSLCQLYCMNKMVLSTQLGTGTNRHIPTALAYGRVTMGECV